MKPLKIAVVTGIFPTRSEPYRGAAIWHTLEHLSCLARIQAFCTQLSYPRLLLPRSFRYHREPAETSAYQVAAQNVPYYAVPWVSRPFNGEMIVRALRDRIAAITPDVLLAYWIYPEGYAAVRLGRALGVPVLIGSRGSDLRSLEDDLPTRILTRFAVPRASAVLCVSAALANYARHYGALTNRIRTIPNGVDRRVFRPIAQAEARERLSVPLNGRLLLFVGWLSELKGVPQLLDAMALLHAYPDCRLVLIGEGYLESELRQRAINLGIAARVSFLGPSTAEEIAVWINASDLLCLPSQSEGCPNVVLEALSCGKPVVATEVGGIPELVDDSCGVLMSSNHPEELARSLNRALEREWDQSAIARIHGRNWTVVAEETYSACEEVSRAAARPVPVRNKVVYES
jgi:teichuronic acid biosynthesis glycosyltransferase TuaC